MPKPDSVYTMVSLSYYISNTLGAIGLSASSQSYRLRYNPILLGNMHCTGEEGSLLNCDHTSSSRALCGNNQDAAILCSLGMCQQLNMNSL